MNVGKDLGTTPVVETPAARWGETGPVLGTQFVHVRLTLAGQVVDPDGRGGVLKLEGHLRCLSATAAGTGTHEAKLRKSPVPMVDIQVVHTSEGGSQLRPIVDRACVR